MKPEHADPRPRIYIEGNRDGRSCTWSRHPAAKGQFAGSPGQALEAALDELGQVPTVVIWSGREPAP